jgi:hypothetical protein
MNSTEPQRRSAMICAQARELMACALRRIEESLVIRAKWHGRFDALRSQPTGTYLSLG